MGICTDGVRRDGSGGDGTETARARRQRPGAAGQPLRLARRLRLRLQQHLPPRLRQLRGSLFQNNGYLEHLNSFSFSDS